MILNFSQFIAEKKDTPKPKGAPDWHDSDAPDAEGRFRDLGIKDLAAWLIKTRKGDVKRISGSLTQQIVFNRKDDPEYAEKMEKTRKEVYKQLGREDLLESFSDRFTKNLYVNLDHKDLREFEDEIFNLIQTAYSAKGGNFEIQKPADLRNTDLNYWIAVDRDNDPEADIVLAGKEKEHGKKMTILGQDGSQESKRDAIQKLIDLMKTRGFYAEVDPDLAAKMKVKPITDERKIRDVVGKDDIEIKGSGVYTRSISGKKKEKVLIGLPK